MYIVSTGKQKVKVKTSHPFLAFKMSGHRQDDDTLTEIRGKEGTYICNVVGEGRLGRTVEILKIA